MTEEHRVLSALEAVEGALKVIKAFPERFPLSSIDLLEYNPILVIGVAILMRSDIKKEDLRESVVGIVAELDQAKRGTVAK